MNKLEQLAGHVDSRVLEVLRELHERIQKLESAEVAASEPLTGEVAEPPEETEPPGDSPESL